MSKFTQDTTKYAPETLESDISPKKWKVGIVGVGMVGGAVRDYFESKGYDLFLYDKHKELGSIKEVSRAEVIFVCVPTPFDEERGCDTSIVENVVDKIRGTQTIVLKSTVKPGTTYKLQDKYKEKKFLHNPEFLTEASAQQDMKYPDRQIAGYTEESYDTAKDILMLLPRAPYERIVPAHISEFVKYFCNTWFSTKIAKNNEFYDLFKEFGGTDKEYEVMVEASGADKRIGMSHLKIHHRGKRGYAGKCLPKDTKAILKLAEKFGVDMPVLESTDEYNDKLLKGQNIDPLNN